MTEKNVSPLALECPSCLAKPGDRCTTVNTTRHGKKFGEPTEHLHQPRLLEARVRGRLAKAWDEGYLRGTLDATSDLEPADNPYRASVIPPAEETR